MVIRRSGAVLASMSLAPGGFLAPHVLVGGTLGHPLHLLSGRYLRHVGRSITRAAIGHDAGL
jgi:hypothetical protein